MKSFAEQLLTYQQQHTKSITRMTHYIGVPAIVFSILMLLNWISIDIATRWQISFSWLILVSVLVYYFLLNIRLALVTTVVMIPLTWLAVYIARPYPTSFSGTFFLILFFGGWILQFVGHFFEQQKPAFLVSLSQLLIAPLFIIVEALRALKISHYAGV